MTIGTSEWKALLQTKFHRSTKSGGCLKSGYSMRIVMIDYTRENFKCQNWHLIAWVGDDLKWHGWQFDSLTICTMMMMFDKSNSMKRMVHRSTNCYSYWDFYFDHIFPIPDTKKYSIVSVYLTRKRRLRGPPVNQLLFVLGFLFWSHISHPRYKEI